MYPKSIYKDDSSIVVWSPEEHAAKTADGWSDDKQPAITLVVEPSTADETASGISTPDDEAPPAPLVQKPKARSAKKS